MIDQRQLWNDRYREKGAGWGVEPNQFVAAFLGDLEPCRVLDVGTGQGRNAIWLARRGHRVTAVDISDVAVGQAREIAKEEGVEVEFVVADFEQWEPDAEAYDLVLLAYIQVAEPVRKLIHAKVERALAPSGKVFIIAHHSDNLDHGLGGPQSPERLFDENMVAEDFDGFEIEENRAVIRHVDRDGVVGDAIDLLYLGVKPPA